MAGQEYKEISPGLLEQVRGSAYSIESRAGHQAEHRALEYMGSTTQGKRVRDYYRDSAGGWWYQNRAIVDGCIVSMEMYLFGKGSFKRVRTKKWSS